jgi:integrase
LLKKDLNKATKNGIIRIVGLLEKGDYSDWTKHDYKVTFKRFYKWLRKTEEGYPEEVRWIKTTMKNNSRKLPEEILTEAEVKRMIEVADHPRDKTLVFVLYESGCRIGELLSMKIKNVQFDKYGAQIIVSGKTGQRRIRLVSSAPFLVNWRIIQVEKNLSLSFGTESLKRTKNHQSYL